MLRDLCNFSVHEVSVLPVWCCSLVLRRGFFLAVHIHVLHDGKEDTEVFHRLDQPADHADGLGARVEVDAFFSLLLFEGSVLENGGARNDCVSGFLFFLF